MHGLFTQSNRRRDPHSAIRRIDSEIHVLDPFAHDLNNQVFHVDLLLYHGHASPTIQYHSEWEEYKAFFSMSDSPDGGINTVRVYFTNNHSNRISWTGCLKHQIKRYRATHRSELARARGSPIPPTIDSPRCYPGKPFNLLMASQPLPLMPGFLPLQGCLFREFGSHYGTLVPQP